VETVSGLEASLVSLLGHAVARGFVTKVKSNLIRTFFNGTKELGFFSLVEEFLMCWSPLGEKKTFARGDFKSPHGVFVAV
jgi:hypothetical protein